MKLTDEKDMWRREGRQIMVLGENDEVFLSQADLVCMLAELQADALRRDAEVPTRQLTDAERAFYRAVPSDSDWLVPKVPKAEVPDHVFIHGGLKGSQLVPKAELPTRAELAEEAIERSARRGQWLCEGDVGVVAKPDHVPVSAEEEAAIDKAFKDSPPVRWSDDEQRYVMVDPRVDPGCSGACAISPHTCDEKCGWQSR